MIVANSGEDAVLGLGGGEVATCCAGFGDLNQKASHLGSQSVAAKSNTRSSEMSPSLPSHMAFAVLSHYDGCCNVLETSGVSLFLPL